LFILTLNEDYVLVLSMESFPDILNSIYGYCFFMSLVYYYPAYVFSAFRCLLYLCIEFHERNVFSYWLKSGYFLATELVMKILTSFTTAA